MPVYSKKSRAKLEQCDYRLYALFERVIIGYDNSILEGSRSEATQNEYYRTGRSKVKWPNSKHNAIAPKKSRAIDATPYPIPDDWGNINMKERAKFYHFAGYVKGIADEMGIHIRWGGDWDGDNDFDDQTFDDLVHFELI